METTTELLLVRRQTPFNRILSLPATCICALTPAALSPHYIIIALHALSILSSVFAPFNRNVTSYMLLAYALLRQYCDSMIVEKVQEMCLRNSHRRTKRMQLAKWGYAVSTELHIALVDIAMASLLPIHIYYVGFSGVGWLVWSLAIQYSVLTRFYEQCSSGLDRQNPIIDTEMILALSTLYMFTNGAMIELQYLTILAPILVIVTIMYMDGVGCAVHNQFQIMVSLSIILAIPLSVTDPASYMVISTLILLHNSMLQIGRRLRVIDLVSDHALNLLSLLVFVTTPFRLYYPLLFASIIILGFVNLMLAISLHRAGK
jgi:hypothetical protein